MQDIVFAKIEKNLREEVRVARTNYKGHDLIDVRVFVNADGKDNRLPTQKGLTFKPAMLPKLIEALLKVQSAIEAAGE